MVDESNNLEKLADILSAGQSEFTDAEFTAKILEIFTRILASRTQKQKSDLADRNRILADVSGEVGYTENKCRFNIPSKSDSDHSMVLEISITKQAPFRSHETHVKWYFLVERPGETFSSFGCPNAEWLQAIEARLTERYLDPLADIEHAKKSALKDKEFRDVLSDIFKDRDKRDGNLGS